jgi:hypothetical protein
MIRGRNRQNRNFRRIAITHTNLHSTHFFLFLDVFSLFLDVSVIHELRATFILLLEQNIEWHGGVRTS